jgi:prepilin-type processing-associated H-X9-DG protein
LYANDHGGHYPNTFGELFEEDLISGVFVCPDTNDTPATGATTQALAANLTAGGHLSYIYLGKGMIQTVSGKLVVAYEPLANHKTGMNVLYGDGHVTFVELAAAQKMLAELAAGHNPPRADGAK